MNDRRSPPNCTTSTPSRNGNGKPRPSSVAEAQLTTLDELLKRVDELEGKLAKSTEAASKPDKAEPKPHRSTRELKGAFAKILRDRGEKNWNVLAAALVDLVRHRKGDLFASARPTHESMLRCLGREPGLRKHVNRSCERDRIVPSTVLAVFSYLVAQRDADQAAEFMEKLHSGAWLAEASPVLLARKYLIRQLASPQKGDRAYTYLILGKAWNAWRRGVTPCHFRISIDSPFPELA